MTATNTISRSKPTIKKVQLNELILADSKHVPNNILTCNWTRDWLLNNHVNAIQNANQGIPWQEN